MNHLRKDFSSILIEIKHDKIVRDHHDSDENQLIDIYNQQHQHLLPVLRTDEENEIHPTNNEDLIKSNSYPDDRIIIRFDCIIQDYRTYVELLSALRSSTPNIQLQICTIDMRCIGLALVSNFLDHVDKRVSDYLRSSEEQQVETLFL